MVFQPEDVDLVCLGDSITQKFEWQDVFPGWKVANRGIGSDTTEGILARLDSVSALDPTIISLMVGINDLGSSTPEETAVSYAALLDALAVKLPNAVVVVSGLLPVAEAHPINNQNVQALNTALKELCRERSLTFLDLYEAFAGKEGNLRPEYALDNVHLSAEGYRMWLSYLIPALEAAMLS